MSAAEVEESADWCISDGQFSMCGTRMKEHSRTSEGVKWCFCCRKRVEFVRVVTVPDGPSYYGPNVTIKCTNCGADDGDLFPGWSREWDES